jgi:hypothetical protein
MRPSAPSACRKTGDMVRESDGAVAPPALWTAPFAG